MGAIKPFALGTPGEDDGQKATLLRWGVLAVALPLALAAPFSLCLVAAVSWLAVDQARTSSEPFLLGWAEIAGLTLLIGLAACARHSRRGGPTRMKPTPQIPAEV